MRGKGRKGGGNEGGSKGRRPAKARAEPGAPSPRTRRLHARRPDAPPPALPRNDEWEEEGPSGEAGRRETAEPERTTPRGESEPSPENDRPRRPSEPRPKGRLPG